MIGSCPVGPATLPGSHFKKTDPQRSTSLPNKHSPQTHHQPDHGTPPRPLCIRPENRQATNVSNLAARGLPRSSNLSNRRVPEPILTGFEEKPVLGSLCPFYRCLRKARSGPRGYSDSERYLGLLAALLLPLTTKTPLGPSGLCQITRFVLTPSPLQSQATVLQVQITCPNRVGTSRSMVRPCHQRSSVPRHKWRTPPSSQRRRLRWSMTNSGGCPSVVSVCPHPIPRKQVGRRPRSRWRGVPTKASNWPGTPLSPAIKAT